MMMHDSMKTSNSLIFGKILIKINTNKKVALISQLMNSEDPKKDAIMILKELSNEN